MTTPIEPESESGASGIAYGEFGPIELDPSARQTLEQVLGTGGSQFPVTILMKDQLNLTDESDINETEEIDGKIYVNSHVIKICFQDIKALHTHLINNSGASRDEVLSLKYTIDYPRVELHPFDTRKFKIFYADHKMDAKYDFNKCIELKALSR